MRGAQIWDLGCVGPENCSVFGTLGTCGALGMCGMFGTCGTIRAQVWGWAKDKWIFVCVRGGGSFPRSFGRHLAIFVVATAILSNFFENYVPLQLASYLINEGGQMQLYGLPMGRDSDRRRRLASGRGPTIIRAH